MSLETVVAGEGAVLSINQNFDALKAAATYSRRMPGSSGLTWAYNGGRAFGNAIADGTLTLTGSATNYIVAARSNGAPSVSTSTTNWDNSTDYVRLYEVLAGSTTVTSYIDHRDFIASGGGGGGGPVSWGDLTDVPAPIEDIAALTDPGADRLLFWDDSAGEYTHLQLGTNLSITGTTLNASGGGGGGGAVDSVNGQTGDVVLDASDVEITDAGGYFTSTSVEGALQELGAGGGGGGGRSVMTLIYTSTDGSNVILTTDGGAPSGTNQLVLDNNQSMAIRGLISARSTGADGKAWSFVYLLRRGASAGSVEIVGGTTTVIAQTGGASSWDLSFSVDTTYGAFRCRVNGAAATTVNWKCVIEEAVTLP